MWVHIVIFIILLCALAGWEKGWIPSSGIGGKEGIRLFMVVAISGNLLGMILTAGNGRQVYPQGYRLEKEDTGSYEKEFMVPWMEKSRSPCTYRYRKKNWKNRKNRNRIRN